MPDRRGGGRGVAEEKEGGIDVVAPSLDDDPDRRQRRSSVLVLFRGLPGAGKSTLARAVSLELGGAPLVDKDDFRDALAEVFEEAEESSTSREKLNEASYAAAFNAARTLFRRSRCPCVLLDSPLSLTSMAERALRLAEELQGGKEEDEEDDDDDNDGRLSNLAFVVVAVGSSDERLWRRRLEARAAALERSGSLSARHKPKKWAEVEALRDRGRRELQLQLLGGGEEEEDRGGGCSLKEESSFRATTLRDLGVVVCPSSSPSSSSSPFARLWRAASARFVVDTAWPSKIEGKEGGGGGRGGGATREAAREIAAAVRHALTGGDSKNDNSSNVVVFLE